MASSMAASSATSTSSANSPCAACKFLRRKCQPDCVFAPYFPPDEPQKFVKVHRVFGASNVTKLLNELQPYQREDAVNSLAYEAQTRLEDPVYGCVGIISVMQQQLRQLQADLARAKVELSHYQSQMNPHANSFVHAGGGGFINQIGMGGFAFQGDINLQGTNQQHPPHNMMMRGYNADFEAKLAMNDFEAKLGIDDGYNNSGVVVAAPMINASAADMGYMGIPFMKSGQDGGDAKPSLGPQ